MMSRLSCSLQAAAGKAPLAAIAALVVVAASTRLLPHPPNFTAVPAMAMFSGTVLGRRALAFALPIMAMLLGDLLLAAFVYGAAVFPAMAVVYPAILSCTMVGSLLRRSAGGVVFGAVATTAAFYLVSNFGVFCFFGLYPMTPSGLLACYVAALPFAGNMLTATLLYAVSLVGVLRFVARHWPGSTRIAEGELQ